MKSFNMNHDVYVKLSDLGYKILVDRNNMLAEIAPSIPFKSIEDYKKEADENGYTKFQVWVLFMIFGEHIRLGGNPPFETEIFIDEKNLD